MKTEIKIKRLLDKIAKLQIEVDDLVYKKVEAAQPVAPAVYEQGEEFTDHLVTRGAKY